MTKIPLWILEQDKKIEKFLSTPIKEMNPEMEDDIQSMINFLNIKPQLGYGFQLEKDLLQTLTSLIEKESSDEIGVVSQEQQRVNEIYNNYLNNLLSKNINANGLKLSSPLSDEDQSAFLVKKVLKENESEAFSVLKEMFDFKSKLNKDGMLAASLRQNKISDCTLFNLNRAIKGSEDVRMKSLDYLNSKLDSKLMRNQKLRNSTLQNTSSSDLFISYDEAITLVVKAFNSVNPKMAALVEEMNAKGLIEYKVLNGKRSGACAVMLKDYSIALLSFENDLTSVISLAHELGHAYHHSLLRDLPVNERKYPVVLAETASMIAENIVIDYLIEEYKDSDSLLQLLHSRIIKTYDLTVMLPSRFSLEEAMEKLYETNNFNLQSLNAVTRGIDALWYGINQEDSVDNHWMLIRHYFMPDIPYYNYPYYFGFLLVELLSGMKSQDGFADKLDDFLKMTGKYRPDESILRSFDVDINSISPWVNAMDKVSEKLDADLKALEKK